MRFSIIIFLVLFSVDHVYGQLQNTNTDRIHGFMSVPVIKTASSSEVYSPSELLPQAIMSFYEADWNKSSVLFQRLKLQNKYDLRPYFYEAMIPFWNYFFGGSSIEKADEFLQLSDIAIQVGEQQLKFAPNDTSAILLLSGLHGYRSLVAAQEKRYRTAMNSGITGYSYTKTLMTMDNNDPNTLMGQGVFNYMMGSIPSEIRWMARLTGLTGDKQHGLMLLERAALADSHVSNDARMFLAYLYERDQEYVKAISHLEILAKKYPSNPIFYFNLAKISEFQGNFERANEFYAKVILLNSSSISDLRLLSEIRVSQLKKNHLQ